jgi:hypothetical protein
MTHHVPLTNPNAVIYHATLITAIRCWHKARDIGLAVQPCLYRSLAPEGYEMLAPVFDSLMTLYENALGRRVAIGEMAGLSSDENLLLAIFDGSRSRRACIDCPSGAGASLDCAICATRIMMGMALNSKQAL